MANIADYVDAALPRRSTRDEADLELPPCDYGKPQISVRKQEGAYIIKGAMKLGIHPDKMYNIITDHESTPRIFKSINKVEIEEKECGKLVTQHARWNFFVWSGMFSVRLLVKEDRQSRSFKFQLQEPGFLKIFNGEWNVNPFRVEGEMVGSVVQLKQQLLPKLVSPGPFSRCLCSVLSSQVRTLFYDLKDEADATREGLDKKEAACS